MGQPPVPPAAQPHQPQQVIDGPGRRAQGRRGQVCAQLHVDGRIAALTYEDAPEGRGGGLFSRLFG